MSRKNKEKGQALSTESVFAYLIFLIIFGSIIFLWNQTTTDVGTSEHHIEVQNIGIVIAENLVRNSGVPSNWTEYNYMAKNASDLEVEVVGLANESRILEEEKMKAFIKMFNCTNSAASPNCANQNYSSHKWVLGLSRAKFNLEFYANFTYLNGSQAEVDNMDCFTGKKPTKGSIYEFPIKRTAILNDKIVRMKLIVWNPRN